MKSNNKYTKSCPICGKEMFYTQKSHLLYSIRSKTPCKKCSGTENDKRKLFAKDCPMCGKTITYTQKSHLSNSIRNNKCCFTCGSKKKRGKRVNYDSYCTSCNKKVSFRKNSYKKNFICRKCKFYEKAKSIHNNKYRYLFDDYIDQQSHKITIICPIHGKFTQLPHNHEKGAGCPKCCVRTIPYTTESFIKRAKEIHGELYDYSEVVFVRIKDKIKIKCKHHGVFKATGNSHLSGHGCPICFYRVSKPEVDFLNEIGIKERQVKICGKEVDGYDPKTNTIYEFLGDYWHGNPDKYNSNSLNKKVKKTFSELYEKTIKRLRYLKSMGYTVKYIWGSDWKNYKKRKTHTLNIQELH